jgi:hypothetical protein
MTACEFCQCPLCEAEVLCVTAGGEADRVEFDLCATCAAEACLVVQGIEVCARSACVAH